MGGRLLVKKVQESGIDEKVLRDYDEKLASSTEEWILLDSDDELSLEIFKAYSSTILKTVEEGPCVMMERGADIVLRGKVDFLNVYTYTSDIKKKIERCMRVVGVREEDASQFIASQSMQRKLYYKTFSNIERGKMGEYDLCLNTDVFDTDALAMGKSAQIIKLAL